MPPTSRRPDRMRRTKTCVLPTGLQRKRMMTPYRVLCSLERHVALKRAATIARVMSRGARSPLSLAAARPPPCAYPGLPEAAEKAVDSVVGGIAEALQQDKRCSDDKHTAVLRAVLDSKVREARTQEEDAILRVVVEEMQGAKRSKGREREEGAAAARRLKVRGMLKGFLERDDAAVVRMVAEEVQKKLRKPGEDVAAGEESAAGRLKETDTRRLKVRKLLQRLVEPEAVLRMVEEEVQTLGKEGGGKARPDERADSDACRLKVRGLLKKCIGREAAAVMRMFAEEVRNLHETDEEEEEEEEEVAEEACRVEETDARRLKVRGMLQECLVTLREDVEAEMSSLADRRCGRELLTAVTACGVQSLEETGGFDTALLQLRPKLTSLAKQAEKHDILASEKETLSIMLEQKQKECQELDEALRKEKERSAASAATREVASLQALEAKIEATQARTLQLANMLEEERGMRRALSCRLESIAREPPAATGEGGGSYEMLPPVFSQADGACSEPDPRFPPVHDLPGTPLGQLQASQEATLASSMSQLTAALLKSTKRKRKKHRKRDGTRTEKKDVKGKKRRRGTETSSDRSSSVSSSSSASVSGGDDEVDEEEDPGDPVEKALEELRPARWTIVEQKALARFAVPRVDGKDRDTLDRVSKDAAAVVKKPEGVVRRYLWANKERLAELAGKPDAKMPNRPGGRWSEEELEQLKQVKAILRNNTKRCNDMLAREVLSELTGRPKSSIGHKL